jgi:hypothetical protein
VVFNDARPGVRSTFGPVSLAYEPELKVGFCVDRPNSCGCVSVRRRGGREKPILPGNWRIQPGGPSLCTPRLDPAARAGLLRRILRPEEWFLTKVGTLSRELVNGLPGLQALWGSGIHRSISAGADLSGSRASMRPGPPGDKLVSESVSARSDFRTGSRSACTRIPGRPMSARPPSSGARNPGTATNMGSLG